MKRETNAEQIETGPLSTGRGRRLIQRALTVLIVIPFLGLSYWVIFERGYGDFTREREVMSETGRRARELPRRTLSSTTKLHEEWERIESDVRRESAQDDETGQGLFIHW